MFLLTCCRWRLIAASEKSKFSGIGEKSQVPGEPKKRLTSNWDMTSVSAGEKIATGGLLFLLADFKDKRAPWLPPPPSFLVAPQATALKGQLMPCESFCNVPRTNPELSRSWWGMKELSSSAFFRTSTGKNRYSRFNVQSVTALLFSPFVTNFQSASLSWV